VCLDDSLKKLILLKMLDSLKKINVWFS